jgi:hypothetical protein
MSYYHGNESGQIPGAFPTKWWEGSALFMAMLQYQYFTGDQTYNSEVSLGLQWQAGDGDYMPSNYSSYLVSTPLNKGKAMHLTSQGKRRSNVLGSSGHARR